MTPIWCRLGLHSWESARNPDGDPILRCRRCGQLDVPTKTIRLRDYKLRDRDDRRRP